MANQNFTNRTNVSSTHWHPHCANIRCWRKIRRLVSLVSQSLPIPDVYLSNNWVGCLCFKWFNRLSTEVITTKPLFFSFLSLLIHVDRTIVQLLNLSRCSWISRDTLLCCNSHWQSASRRSTLQPCNYHSSSPTAIGFFTHVRHFFLQGFDVMLSGCSRGAMFQSVVTKLVETVGRDYFLPCPSLTSSENILPLSLVERKASQWWFGKNHYYPTELNLADVVSNPAQDFKVNISFVP